MSSPIHLVRRYPISAFVLLACLFGLAMSGSATAARVITGEQIQDNSISPRDITNGSLKVTDFKASEATKLRGPAGATGANGANGTAGAPGVTGATEATGAAGAAGASAFNPPA